MPNTQNHGSSNTSTSTALALAGPSSGPNGVAPSLSSGGDDDASVEATTRSPEARTTARPTVAFDAEYSPEIVEYFARRYQDVKAELDGLKVSVVMSSCCTDDDFLVCCWSSTFLIDLCIHSNSILSFSTNYQHSRIAMLCILNCRVSRLLSPTWRSRL